MRVLMITPEWISPQFPQAVPFIVRQVDFLRRAGVDVDVFHFRGGQNPYNYIRAWFRAQRLLLDRKYDIVHAQWGQSALLALPKRVPLVITFRGSDLEGILGENGRYSLGGRFLRQFSRFAANIADEVIVVSNRLARQLPHRKRYCVIPSGLDLELFHPIEQKEARRLLGLPFGKKIVFFGGNPSAAVKRYDLAQKALGLLAKDFPDIQLLSAQDIDHHKMVYYLNASDVLLLVSRHEGSPNVVKEALACNLPVVSTDVGDVRERIGDIDGCWICEDGFPETISAALKQALTRASRVDGRSAILSLDENLLTRQVLDVYQNALTKKKPQ